MSLWDNSKINTIEAPLIGTDEDIARIKEAKVNSSYFYASLEGHGITRAWLAERGLNLHEYLMPVMPEFFTYDVLAKCFRSTIDLQKEFRNGVITFAGVNHLRKLGILPEKKVKELIRFTMPSEEIDMLIEQCTKDSMSTRFMCDTRDLFIEFFSWSIPSIDNAMEIRKFIEDDMTLEVGGGTGIWTNFLDNVGVNIVCTDNFSSRSPFNYEWYPVLVLEAEVAVKVYKPACLFVSWGNGALKSALRAFKGNKIVVIGEGLKEHSSAEHLDGHDASEWKLQKTISIQRWHGYTDAIRCYTRK